MNYIDTATPIQKLNMDLGGNTFYMKREDLVPFSFGGNKVRKGILFFEAMKAEASDHVVTYGSSSSNHCRVIANLSAANGYGCSIISPAESNNETFNSRLVRLLGAEVISCSLDAVKETIEDTMKALTQKGKKPYFIPGGGHGRLGTEAYVKAYEEIRTYEQTYGIYFDFIFLTSGTGTTQAGLVCGQINHGDERKIIGISNARANPYGGQVVVDSINEYYDHETPLNEIKQKVHFIDDYILQGYGSYHSGIIDTIKEVFEGEGVPMDTTYTGKGFWGMKEYLKENHETGKNVLFIHTGGTPLFFNAMAALENE